MKYFSNDGKLIQFKNFMLIGVPKLGSRGTPGLGGKLIADHIVPSGKWYPNERGYTAHTTDPSTHDMVEAVSDLGIAAAGAYGIKKLYDKYKKSKKNKSKDR